ncbi:MAG: hypothetical protein RLZ12_730 [Bacillota bacterium]
MEKVMRELYGNPASLHSVGQRAERVVAAAKEKIAQELYCDVCEVILTSGGTESNNLAIQGLAFRYARTGKHLITTKIEHPSVIEVFRTLERQGFSVTYLDVDVYGRVLAKDLAEAIRPDTILFSIAHVNNELGVVQPIEQLGEVVRSFPNLHFHVDAVQSFAKIVLKPAKYNIALLTISAHKFSGPQGIGALYKRKNLHLKPLFFGGGETLRPGTVPVAIVAGMAQALLLAQKRRVSFWESSLKWRELLLAQWKSSLKHWNLNGDVNNTVPYIINLSFKGLKSEVIVHALAEKGLIISNRAACSSKRDQNRVVLALGASKEVAEGALRISFGYQTKLHDILVCARLFEQVILELQQLSGLAFKRG